MDNVKNINGSISIDVGFVVMCAVLYCLTGSDLGSGSESESEVTISSISTNDFYVDVGDNV